MPKLIRKTLLASDQKGAVKVDTGIDVIGEIAIVRLSGLKAVAKRRFAGELLKSLPNVKSVFEQEGGIEGEFRLRKLRFVYGVKSTMTLHKENGCRYRVDVARCYFSPRLSTERLRVAEIVSPGERVLNMFAGVGPFSIPIAKRKHVKVTSCELNSVAAELHVENNALNKVQELVQVVEADAHELPGMVGTKFDRILMPHPTKSNEFLADAISMAAPGATIHYYRQVLGRDETEASDALDSELKELLPGRTSHKARRVREIGPRWIEMAADIRLPV